MAHKDPVEDFDATTKRIRAALRDSAIGPLKVHEMWHVWGSPIAPQDCDDQIDIRGIAWEMALLRQIGCPLTKWQGRWAQSACEGGFWHPWPEPPSGRLGDASARRFMTWANAMIETGKTTGYTIHGGRGLGQVTLGCVRDDGRPVMLRSDLRPRW